MLAIHSSIRAGIAFSVPLPLWDSGKANVDSAEARRIQAQASLLATQREVERGVTEAAVLYQTLQQRLKAWKPETLASFKEAAALADRHYRLGAVEIATYVEMQEKYLEATEAINQTRSEALLAALNLEQLTGAGESLIKASPEPAPAEGDKKSQP